ncbi:TPA: radical SAM protein, partial [Candidatus Bathyarchaeota archaeon]|nr:radical SAM protein [Candidatus Bathyarchaeota archaeon]
MFPCTMAEQGYQIGSCMVKMPNGFFKPACQATLKRENGKWFRLIKSAHLSRPEDYFSIYQSGCNHSCLKCHSWEFSQNYNGFWSSTDRLAEMASEYEVMVTVQEPRERATMYHAADLCRHCGLCIIQGVRGEFYPRKLHK